MLLLTLFTTSTLLQTVFSHNILLNIQASTCVNRLDKFQHSHSETMIVFSVCNISEGFFVLPSDKHLKVDLQLVLTT